MFLVHVNYLAVLLCGVAAMIIGYLWYGPLFGKEWKSLVGMTDEKMKKATNSMLQNYAAMFLYALVMAYVLAHFIWYAAPGSLTLFIAVKTAVWAWLGFVATVSLTKLIFDPDRKPMKLLVIETAYQLVTLVVMGVIFGVLK
jgi:hypothetical protein